MEVEKIFDDASLMAFFFGLRPRTRFWWSIYKDGPQTYHEFLGQLEKHITTEEVTLDQEKTKAELHTLTGKGEKVR